MKIAKKVMSALLCSMFFLVQFSNPLHVNANEADDLATYYVGLFNDSLESYDNVIFNDESAYCFLKDNLQYVSFDDTGVISVNLNDASNDYNLDDTAQESINSFVTRLNTLVDMKAVSVGENLLLTPVSPKKEAVIRLDKNSISIMTECRNHASELKRVYDNAVFSQKHLVAGNYFAERVKSGGIWDYKAYLGTKTVYYVDDLNNNMTGEAIGNFHYGYVGRAVFEASTLKSAAGMYQIISKTSSTGYWKTYFDDPRDQAQIQKGIDKYNSEH